ncbi:MAG: cache domain-containing protein [Thermodesulfovibrionales bacterium]|nr:cache domain-containing protein [Thermodesulfovibrionales bacterium]
MGNTILKTFNLNTLAIVVLFFIAIGSFWLYEDYSRTIKEIEEIERIHIEEHKSIIKKDISNLAKFIEENRKQFFLHAKDHIKSRTYEAVAVAQSVYNYYNSKKSLEEMKEIVRESLRLKRFNNNRGYYFATDTKGIEQLFADRPEMEGKNLLNMTDIDGKYVIKDMIHIAKTKGEGFYEYKWTKPNSQGAHHKKISYIKYFAPFDWFFGTGEYLEDLEKDFVEQMIELIKNMSAGNGSYIFAFDYDGNCFVHPKKELLGQNIIDLKDKNGKPIIRDMIDVARNGSGGYVTYLWESPLSAKIIPKISYVKSIEELKLVIGSGFHPDDFAPLISEKKQSAYVRTQKQIAVIIFIAMFFSVVAVIINRYFMNKIKQDFLVFKDFFRRAIDDNQPIDKNKLNFEEFKVLADAANDMIQRRLALELALESTSVEYSRLFEKMIDGFALHEMIFDDEGNPKDYRFISVNPAFERLTGLKKEDIVGKTVLEVLPDTEYYWIETYGNVVKTGQTVNFDSYSGALGKYFEVTAYKHSENKFATIFVDVTERVMAFKNLQEFTTTLEEKIADEVEKRRKQEIMLIQQSKLASMADMLVSIAHHWRQPLNAIGLIVQSLEDDFENATLDKARIRWVVDNVMDRLDHMSKTISSFTDYFNVKHTTDSFALNSLLYNTYILISEEIASNSIDFEVRWLKTNTRIRFFHDLSISDLEETIIKGDTHYIQQVLLALLRNSIESIIQKQKLLQTVSERGLIQILLDDTKDYHIIKIQDNGIGIDPEIEDRIYEPFFTTKEKSFTVGLGLYMSKVIIGEYFKGRLYHEHVDKGAVFVIEIPKG